MNEIIEITTKDNHRLSAYISQPFGKPKAGGCQKTLCRSGCHARRT